MTTPAPSQPFSWGRIAAATFAPTIVFSLGEGALIPIIPVVAYALGADLAGAGLIAAMLVIGKLLGDLPSGTLVARTGERTAMLIACAVSLVGIGLAILSPTLWALGIGMLLIGTAESVFGLARHALITTVVPRTHRARALSTLGGTHRLGFFVGPFVTAGVIAATGSAFAALWIQFVASIVTAAILLIARDPAEQLQPIDTTTTPAPRIGLWSTIFAKRRVLLTLGFGSASVSALRASRNVILPLWAVAIGVDDVTAAIIIGAAGAVDFALFYTGGWIMDRFGRLWTAVPAMIGLGLGHLMLAFTHDLETAFEWFVAAAAVLAIANGIGSGILMTLGADLADPANPAPFLGAWRFTNDTGAAAAPIALAAVTAAVSLPLAAGVMGVVGLLGALNLRIFVPRYSRR